MTMIRVSREARTLLRARAQQTGEPVSITLDNILFRNLAVPEVRREAEAAKPVSPTVPEVHREAEAAKPASSTVPKVRRQAKPASFTISKVRRESAENERPFWNLLGS